MSLYFSNAVELVFFSVVRPFVFILGPGKRIYRQGESGILNCQIMEGLPEPQLSWYKNDVLLPGKVNTTLRLANVTDTDEGRYTCKAQNAGGDFEASIDITVKSKQLPCTVYQLSRALEFILLAFLSSILLN